VRVWIRWDPTREEAVVEEESGSELSFYPIDIQRDGAFYLIGPLDLEDTT
jgi:hypothetical protein